MTVNERTNANYRYTILNPYPHKNTENTFLPLSFAKKIR